MSKYSKLQTLFQTQSKGCCINFNLLIINMDIIKCKICGKIFFQIVNMTATSDFEYDNNCCKECNKEAKENSK